MAVKTRRNTKTYYDRKKIYLSLNWLMKVKTLLSRAAINNYSNTETFQHDVFENLKS